MEVDGVMEASVSIDTKEAEVTYDPEVSGKEEFAKALKDKDLEAVFEGEENAEESEINFIVEGMH